MKKKFIFQSYLYFIIKNKIFLPPYQRLQESKMKQMNLEQAFENAYNPTPGSF